MLYEPQGSEKDVLSAYYIINAILLSDFHLKDIRMTNRRAWKLTLQDDIQLELDRK
ncbi:cell division septal protein [secondary endosymbiont of Heteropsylla cubana]|uniref:Cell division septal protein n=1 Tax=secondary endosymbiont of Heteropsylla cubana TaxID=134287 RepID=J3TGR0_9ENTR|nr:cell division protein FtsQ/DivIB [secondary endosymbiont of Heteropsylla cubana]AFP85687.1 cell division septal protein [secondary endosymbiont of Heteropsylla cubana]